jgi:hypothetical protein
LTGTTARAVYADTAGVATSVVSITGAQVAAAGGITNVPTLQQVVNAGGTATGNVVLAAGAGDNMVAGPTASGANKTTCTVLGNHAGLFASGDSNFYGGNGAGRWAAGNNNFHGGDDSGISASGDYNFYGGFTAGGSSSGNYNFYGGPNAGYASKTTNSTFLGLFAGRNATGNDRLFVDSYPADPGAGYNPTNDSIVIDGNTTNLYLGRPTGTLNLRGAVNLGGTNLQATLAGKLDTTGSGGSLTGLTVGQVAGAVSSNGGVATNITLSGATTLTNGTTYSAGAYYGTNGVFWTRDGTNYWILFQ